MCFVVFVVVVRVFLGNLCCFSFFFFYFFSCGNFVVDFCLFLAYRFGIWNLEFAA